MSKKIDEFLKLCSDKVQKNVTVVTPEDLGQDFFLHIGTDRMGSKVYIPKISERAANSEDHTVPRVTVSPTLMGCYIGYFQLFHQVLNYDPEYNDVFPKQGLYIHELKFDYALKPTNKLVFDGGRSDEHWLVTYDETTREYKPSVIGKMFISEIKIKQQTGEKNAVTASFRIEVNKKEGIRFSKNIFLKQGYWSVDGVSESEACSWDKDKNLVVRELTKAEYEADKKLSAAMLGFEVQNAKPSSLSW